MSTRLLILIDGENLVTRFQMSVEAGREPQTDVIHEKDAFLWQPALTTIFGGTTIRVSYYTTFVGADDELAALRRRIASTYWETANFDQSGTLVPYVFKKPRQQQKSKSVDINITIDALRHTYNNSTDRIFLLSGDGDYLPLIEEIMRQGKQVHLGAFSSGLNPVLPDACDDFIDLDGYFFKKAGG